MDTNLVQALIYLCTNAGNYFATQTAIHASNHSMFVDVIAWVRNNLTASIAILAGSGFAASHPVVRSFVVNLFAKSAKAPASTQVPVVTQPPAQGPNPRVG
jgi:hypothetical protein